jgi:hypothetical protein
VSGNDASPNPNGEAALREQSVCRGYLTHFRISNDEHGELVLYQSAQGLMHHVNYGAMAALARGISFPVSISR